MIEVSGLSKRFGAVVALDDVSFAAPDGRITGLLGPNGAGKSTCLRILYTVLKPDAGYAKINDVDVVEHPLWARRELGVLPHGAGLYPQLTTRENIAYFGRLHGIKEPALSARIDQLVARLELEEIADRRAKGFSQGQRTKVALARALVHRPKNLLLDEPTNGLDVMSTLSLRNWLSELKARGQCIVLSSHIMQEVAALCDDIVIVAHGRIVAQGTTEALRERFGNKSLEDIFVETVAGS
ncbi:MAG: ATP-binding cassette domain-containing protein [Gammaproteobacteria bacterium]|nr:ATP-binding cassette domain-containing protein [Gammaproteobacteria bacterium]